MPLKDLSIRIGGSSSGFTGGTDTAVVDGGGAIDSHRLYLGGTSALDRTVIDTKYTEPKVSPNAPAGYTQARNSMVFKFPKTLSNDKSTINTVRFEMATDRETTDAEKAEYLLQVAQALLSANAADFFESGASA